MICHQNDAVVTSRCQGAPTGRPYSCACVLIAAPPACSPPPSVASAQVVFEFTQQQGRLVGFWCPPFVGSHLNVPGFHFHFLSADKQRGGHLLEVQVQQGAQVYLQEVRWVSVFFAFFFSGGKVAQAAC